MSYVSLLKNIPEILSQPTGIAAIASLGIHGAIALIVPLMPVDSHKTKESESKKTVGIMELSQADQNRLPQPPNPSPAFSQSQLPLGSQFPLPSRVPPLNLGNQGTSLPPLPPPPASSQLVLPPPIPKSLAQYRVSSLPKGNLRFDTSAFSANRRFSPSVPRFNSDDIKLGAAKPLPIDKLPTLPAAKIPDGLPNYPGTNPSPTEVNPATQGTQPANNPAEVAQDEQLVARIDKTPQTSDNLTLGRESLPQWQRESSAKLPDELTSKTAEQAISQVNSYEDLRKTVRQEYPNVEEKAVIRDTIATDKPELEGTVTGGLVIDPDGKVLEIKFQDKSVSRDLLSKAREYFIANTPKGHTKTSYYPFRLQFQNKTGNNAGANQESAPTPAATNKPLSNPAVNSKQPLSTPASAEKPLSNPVENSKQPAPTPAAITKPLSNPVENSKQPAPTPAAITKPLFNPAENSKQPASTPAAITKPLSNPAENSKQPASTPAAITKPSSNPAVNNKQPLSTPASADKPSSASNDNKNEPVTVVEPGKKLIQQLRELREKKESSNQEK